MWLTHWGLKYDPFQPGSVPYVATSQHEEAIARFLHLVAQSERRADIRGVSGLGKSVVLRQTLIRLHDPSRQTLYIERPADPDALLRSFAEGLGAWRIARQSTPIRYSDLVDAARVTRGLGISVVAAIDGDELLGEADHHRLFDRLTAVGEQSGLRLSLLIAGQSPLSNPTPWTLAVRLHPLTVSEAKSYLSAKLKEAGLDGFPISDSALQRLHAITLGLPGALDRLCSLSLRAAALDGLSHLNTRVLEAVSVECHQWDSILA